MLAAINDLKPIKERYHHGEATRFARILLAAALSVGLLGACSIKQTAVDLIGDAITGGKANVYMTDDDPDLVLAAIPFGLKTYEGMLEASPEHRGLLLATAQGFTAYAFLLQRRADRIDGDDLGGARKLRARARKLYLRGRDYALRGLETAHDEFTAKLKKDPRSALAATVKDDVPFLYWAGVSWAGALSAAMDDLDLVAEMPLAGMLVARVLVLDEAYDRGAPHEFFVSFESARPGGSAKKVRAHYRRGLELSRGQRASVHLAFAEAVALPTQDLPEFRRLIAKTLAVDPDHAPDLRLVNTIARHRALWLQSRIPDLFLDAEPKENDQ